QEAENEPDDQRVRDGKTRRKGTRNQPGHDGSHFSTDIAMIGDDNCPGDYSGHAERHYKRRDFQESDSCTINQADKSTYEQLNEQGEQHLVVITLDDDI